MKRLLCLVAMVGFLAGCGKGYAPSKVQLQQLGILGQHELRYIEQTNKVSGNITRKFFIGEGSMSSYEWKLQFCWGRNPNELIFTTLPYNKFRFVIDESKSLPTVEFMFTDSFLKQGRLPYTELEKSSMSEWGHKTLTWNAVVVRISLEDLQEEIYLPQR
jgi:hypothetical protein